LVNGNSLVPRPPTVNTHFTTTTLEYL